VDHGNLDEHGYPVSPQSSTICVAPEVVHLSRFAESYQLYPELKALMQYNKSIEMNGELF
jgi:hypothetical protein